MTSATSVSVTLKTPLFGQSKVDTRIDKILYACVYRSHSGDQKATRLFDHLSEAADVALNRYPTAQLVFLGDFNACHQDWLFPYQKTFQEYFLRW
ncbi:unnamed protein product [Parnassius mnemosyne]|uniref:Endonuclease/exonuclease/phosphatase domain-containing protein n=1 Tax=Parnassius mnemosyne TaxID=213953 RepID=A0AAV1L6Y5_9NEOP